jgi:hypothetical protein
VTDPAEHHAAAARCKSAAYRAVVVVEEVLYVHRRLRLAALATHTRPPATVAATRLK